MGWQACMDRQDVLSNPRLISSNCQLCLIDPLLTSPRKLIELRPNYAEGFFNYGTLLVHLKRYVCQCSLLTTCSDEIPAWSTQDEAEEMLNKALAINPNHDKAKNNLEVVKYERAHPKTH